MIGDIMFKLKEWDESMFQYHRILLTRPDDFKTKYKIAQCLINKRKYQEAISLLDEILEERPLF